MAIRYTLTQGASLLGVSTSTLSRHLPAARASQGRPAQLALEELVAMAPSVGADPQDVVRRATTVLAVDPDLPAEIRMWVMRAREEDAHFPLEAYNARIQPDLFQHMLEAPEAEDAMLQAHEPWSGTFRTMPHADLMALLTQEHPDSE